MGSGQTPMKTVSNLVNIVKNFGFQGIDVE